MSGVVFLVGHNATNAPDMRGCQMPLSRLIPLIAVILALGAHQIAQAQQYSKVDQNVEIIADAARKLHFALPENRAYFLEKRATIRSEVAVFFGYLDNAAACEQIARILSESLNVGPFGCRPIY